MVLNLGTEYWASDLASYLNKDLLLSAAVATQASTHNPYLD